jgi:methionine-S-sulfoxide reductase
MNETTQTAYLAGGCFWGIEELVRQIPGVLETEVGYTGGVVPDATYQIVKTGRSGHAESLKVVFDPQLLSYRHLLFEFFRMHDPTTRNQQGNDIGTQYRSAIFYLGDEQKHTAEEVIRTVDASGDWQANGHDRCSPTQTLPRVAGEGSNESLREFNNNVVTEVVPFREFYRAEEYHQKYLIKNRGGYTCHYVRRYKLGEGN